MTTREAVQRMTKMAEARGFQITQGVVYGNFSSCIENGVKVQSVTRTFENDAGEKLTLVFDGATGKIY